MTDNTPTNALTYFRESLLCDKEHHELVVLEENGWIEGMPCEDTWTFFHPDFPGGRVIWAPGRDPSWVPTVTDSIEP